MQKLQLFIDSTPLADDPTYQRVDLFKDESVSMTQTIQNVRDISKIFTEFTQSFTIPASKINNILYKKYVEEGKYKLKLKARNIWNKILDSQIETGMPYICFKDNIKKKKKKKNYGVIKSSNLCVAPETLILTDKGHIEIQTLENKKVNV